MRECFFFISSKFSCFVKFRIQFVKPQISKRSESQWFYWKSVEIACQLLNEYVMEQDPESLTRLPFNMNDDSISFRYHGPPKKYCIPDERVRKGSEQNVPYHEYCNRSQVAKKIWNSGLKINFKFSWDLRIKMWFPAEDFETRNNKRNNSVSLHVWNMKNGYLSMWACLNEYWNDIWNVDAFVFTVIEMIWGNRIKKKNR